MWKWKIVHNGKAPPPGESIGPMERVRWPRMVGVGFQHVITMFPGTFILPLMMGLDANLRLRWQVINVNLPGSSAPRATAASPTSPR